jgi:hypothetical protein
MIEAQTALALLLKKYGPFEFSGEDLANFEVRDYVLVITPNIENPGAITMSLEESQ